MNQVNLPAALTLRVELSKAFLGLWTTALLVLSELSILVASLRAFSNSNWLIETFKLLALWNSKQNITSWYPVL